jgi:hypothetical protein
LTALPTTLRSTKVFIYSDSHDLDLDWVTDSTLGRYLQEIGDKKKWNSYGSPAEIIDKILLGLKPISVAKLLNCERVINYKLSHIDAAECFVDFSVDLDSYLSLIFAGKTVQLKTRMDLKQKINDRLGRQYELRQLTNGQRLLLRVRCKSS